MLLHNPSTISKENAKYIYNSELLGIPVGSSQTSQFFGFGIRLKTELIYYMKSGRWFDFWSFGEEGCFDIHFGGSPVAKFRCTSVLLHDKNMSF